jgi:hypothetical protein
MRFNSRCDCKCHQSASAEGDKDWVGEWGTLDLTGTHSRLAELRETHTEARAPIKNAMLWRAGLDHGENAETGKSRPQVIEKNDVDLAATREWCARGQKAE